MVGDMYFIFFFSAAPAAIFSFQGWLYLCIFRDLYLYTNIRTDKASPTPGAC